MYRTELNNVRVDFDISKDEMKTVQKVRGSRNFEVLSTGVILLAAIEYAYYIAQIGKDIAADPKTAIDRLIQGEVDLTEVPEMIERMDSNILQENYWITVVKQTLCRGTQRENGYCYIP
ncbi:hypothetical protein RHGRI_022880 [Rhododendron griersonianum]|uniref:Uncharacterized protein n=1 Tax=Rhododendron griersonianum TaxID=479676 RepID=A0AAV6J5U7_9ERIC|nr:hypothetical protein RHGRI_022880 [Rhododendron griersonianum]